MDKVIISEIKKLEMIKVAVEFIGISRILTGVSQYEVVSDRSLTYNEIIHLLADRFPKLLNQMIEQKSLTLLPSNLLSKNGTKMIRPENMNETVSDGERLILMSILAGGTSREQYIISEGE